MNSPPASLASLLAYPSSGAPQAAAPPEGDDSAAIMTYFSEQYETENDPHTSNSRTPYLQNGDYRLAAAPKRDLAHADHTAAPLPTTATVPTSPIDNTVPIPPALAALSVPANDAAYLIPLPQSVMDDATFAVALDRGEMGGKRRKQPHERAGWKEMDDAARGEKRQRTMTATGLAEDATQPEQYVGYDVNTGVSLAEHVPLQTPEEIAMAAEQGVDDDKRGKSRTKLTKESRAEQNRKAQQVFRRKREEKMKQLEMDSLSLNTTRQRLAATEARMADLALQLEAKTIEATGLRQSLSTLSQCLGTGFVRADGGLVLTDVEFEARNKDAVGREHLDASFEHLAKASRQLAKVNRQRRIAEIQQVQHQHQHQQVQQVPVQHQHSPHPQVQHQAVVDAAQVATAPQ